MKRKCSSQDKYIKTCPENKKARVQSWDDVFKLLLEHIIVYGCLPNNKSIYKDYEIGKWYTHQKRKYEQRTLSDRQTKLLEEYCGFYIEKRDPHKKHTIILSKYDDREKKYNQDNLNTIQLKVSININNQTQREKKWNKLYNLVLEYCNIHGTVPRCHIKYNDYNIGNWCCRQIAKYRNGKLSQEHIYLLECIPMWIWNWNPNYIIENSMRKCMSLITCASVCEMLIISQRLIYKYGCFELWHYKQLLINYLIKDNRTSMLFTNMMRGINQNRPRVYKRWDESYNLVLEYCNIYGKIPKGYIKYNNYSVGDWCRKQRAKYKNGKLSLKQINLLECLKRYGWKWN